MLTLQCQIGYMICSDQNCSFPGQWTLPPAKLTIKAAGGPASLRLDNRPTAPASPAIALMIRHARRE